MTFTQLLILQFIAHLSGDFIFQTQRFCDKKESSILNRFHFYHFLIVLFLTYLLSFDPGFWKAALLLSLVHMALDILKSAAMRNIKPGSLFFADQILHLVSIAIIVCLYDCYRGIHFLFDMDTHKLAIIAGFLLCAKPANIMIRFLLEIFKIETPLEEDNSKDKSLPNAGKLIGITERFLALALILLAQYSAVGLIIAAKSILRFNDTQKTEYILIGTLLSFAIALFTGIGIELLN